MYVLITTAVIIILIAYTELMIAGFVLGYPSPERASLGTPHEEYTTVKE
jgi:hypothetical protein